MRLNRIFASVAGFAAGVMAVATGAPALAQVAKPWQLGMQEAATPVAEQMQDFHNLLLVIITAITVFVLALLIYVMVRFNAKANPTPSRTTHNTLIEVVWTIVPVLILVAIAIPSFRLLYFQDRHLDPDMTLKVTGHQWYWSYEYPDHGGFRFDSFILPDDQIKAGQHRLLEVDNRVVVPVDTNVRVLMTSADVLHAWAVPAFGVKMDTVPGRLNETWFRVEKEGVYYGQCSELCGVNHGFMPIAIEVVSNTEFENWVASKRQAALPAAKRQAALPAAPDSGPAAVKKAELERAADVTAAAN